MAYQHLELLPWEFYRLTTYEFQRMCDGRQKADDRRLHREATWVAQLMNASGNMEQAMTPERLLGTDKPTTEQKALDHEQLRQRAEARRLQRLADRKERETRVANTG